MENGVFSASKQSEENTSDFPVNQFVIGDILNYGRLLENGQQTQVRMCLHLVSKTFFCIKMEPFLSDEHKQSLLAKGHMQKSAMHPCIVRLYHSFSDVKFVYHIMEYLPGGDLFDMISSIGPLPENLTKRYAAQLILAVEFLHSKHILHNDIKLENLLLNNVNVLRLTDFGLASTEDAQESPSQSINGTPEYMSPETIIKKMRSRSTDWWSVGICIYEMLTGALPFNLSDSDEPMVTLQKIVHGRLSVPDFVSALATDLLIRLLAANFRERLGTNSSEDIKSHKWFADISWDSILHESNSTGVHFVRKLDQTDP